MKEKLFTIKRMWSDFYKVALHNKHRAEFVKLLRTYNEVLTRHDGELEALRTRCTQLETRCTQLETRMSTAESNITTNKNNISTNTTNINTNKNNITSIDSRVTQNTNKINSIQSNLGFEENNDSSEPEIIDDDNTEKADSPDNTD